MNIFFEIHKDLPREAPGDNESTRKALSLLKNVPGGARILDIGCGPGMQTRELAFRSAGSLIALDTHHPFLLNLQRKLKNERSSTPISLINASMFALPFPGSSFDLIWCEGAIYIMGFERGLRAWRRLLKPGGCVCVTEISWLKTGQPDEVFRFWNRDYPGMSNIPGNIRRAEAAGYQMLDHFTVPVSSWWDDYYTPMKARLPSLWEKYRGEAEAEKILQDAQIEIDLYREYSDWYGYEFYIMTLNE
jgi:ubiquinone/menaquinone biosynthesis C-methylase UbiE